MTLRIDPAYPKLSMGSLQKGLVLDMPLQRKYMKSATVLTDRTPYSNDGVVTGATVGADYTSFVASNSDNVRIPDSASLSPTSAMTAMCWVDGAGQGNKYIVAHYDYGNNQRAFALRTQSSGELSVAISDDGTGLAGHMKHYISSITAFDNIWHLVGFTFDAGTLKLFVDGLEDTSITKPTDDPITTIHNAASDVMVGCALSNDSPVSLFDGDLKKPRMWNRALTAAEWLSAYEAPERKLVIDQPVYGVEWDQSANTYTRTGVLA